MTPLMTTRTPRLHKQIVKIITTVIRTLKLAPKPIRTMAHNTKVKLKFRKMLRMIEIAEHLKKEPKIQAVIQVNPSPSKRTMLKLKLFQSNEVHKLCL